jgi:hypothetical protein
VEFGLSPATVSSGLDLPCWQRSKSECSRQPNYSLSLLDSGPLENAVFSLSFCPLTVIQYTQFGDPTDASLFRDRADTRQCTHALDTHTHTQKLILSHSCRNDTISQYALILNHGLVKRHCHTQRIAYDSS